MVAGQFLRRCLSILCHFGAKRDHLPENFDHLSKNIDTRSYDSPKKRVSFKTEDSYNSLRQLPSWNCESPNLAPLNLAEAVDDLDNDCILISQRVTQSAMLLADIIDLLMYDSSTPVVSELSAEPELVELE